MFNNLTIKSRLIFVISFLSLLLVGVSSLGLACLYSANNSLKEMYEMRLVPLGKLDSIVRSIDSSRMAIAETLNGDPAIVAKQMNEAEQQVAAFSSEWNVYASGALNTDEKRIADNLSENMKRFVAEGLNPAITAQRANNSQLTTEILQGPMAKFYSPLRESIDSLIKFQQLSTKSEFEASQAMYANVRNFSILVVVVGLSLACFVGVWTIRSITVPLNEAIDIAASVAAGDLTQKIEARSSDETGKLLGALKTMNESLLTTLGKVRHGTETIDIAARRIAEGNADLSSRTESQASSLEETASSMEQLTTTVRQNADNAREANQLVVAASEHAVKGGSVVKQVVETMGSIKESSNRIVDIIAVIDGIAFQTNILALNAAVEAARAGEQGRGFAVVASEVRSLAQRSAAAAKEIKSLINDSVEKVESGGKLVDEAGKTMEQIVASVKHVANIMSEIAAASAEQTTGIEEVNRAIAQMDEITQQNAALVEEAAGAALSMQEQSVELAQAVAVFKLAQALPTISPNRSSLLLENRVMHPVQPDGALAFIGERKVLENY